MSKLTDSSKYDIHKSTFVVSYRLIILLLGLGDILYANLNYFLTHTTFFPDKFFTYQSNFFVDVWLILALLWRNSPENLEKISGFIHGAVTLYISVTFLVYGIILAPMNHPTGIEVYLNLIHHYIVPFVFILDYFYTEKKLSDWKFIIPWFVYPHLYLIFSLIMGEYITKGDFIYPFLDLDKLGLVGYIRWYLILISLFLILSVIYIGYTKYFQKKHLSVV